MVVAEKGPIVKENCSLSLIARPEQVQAYLLEEFKKVLRGEESEAMIVSYRVNLEDGNWCCLMPQEIEVVTEERGRTSKETITVSEAQWTVAAGVILSRMGHNFEFLYEQYKEDLESAGERGAREIPLSIEKDNLSGELHKLAESANGIKFELVLIGKEVVQDKREWQVLIRRKVDETSRNQSGAA